MSVGNAFCCVCTWLQTFEDEAFGTSCGPPRHCRQPSCKQHVPQPTTHRTHRTFNELATVPVIVDSPYAPGPGDGGMLWRRLPEPYEPPLDEGRVLRPPNEGFGELARVACWWEWSYAPGPGLRFDPPPFIPFMYTLLVSSRLLVPNLTRCDDVFVLVAWSPTEEKQRYCPGPGLPPRISDRSEAPRGPVWARSIMQKVPPKLEDGDLRRSLVGALRTVSPML